MNVMPKGLQAQTFDRGRMTSASWRAFEDPGKVTLRCGDLVGFVWFVAGHTWVEERRAASRLGSFHKESDFSNMATKNRIDRAAELVGDAAGSLEVAGEKLVRRTRQGLREAASAVSRSDSASALEDRLSPARKKVAKATKKAKKAAKKRTAAASRKAAGAKKAAKKRTTTASRKAAGAKKAAKKRTTTASRKAAGAKKAAKKRAASASR
jgi:hypothetical protein